MPVFTGMIYLKLIDMNNKIKEQIDACREKVKYYENKREILQRRIHAAELKRIDIDKLPVSSPRIVAFYTQLDNLYKQLYSLPTKINKYKNFIITLKTEL